MFKIGNQEAKKKGKHEKTKQWEILAESIVTTHTERFNRILAESDDETFIRHYKDILEFFKPKLQRTELKGNVEITNIPCVQFIDSGTSEV